MKSYSHKVDVHASPNTGFMGYDACSSLKFD